MKKFKKFLSAVMASVMCIPITPAYATEQDSDDSYTVTLVDTENGVMQFSEACMEASGAEQDWYHMVRIGEDGTAEQVENDGSIWAFSKGDTVEVELVPHDGYEVSLLTLRNAETGNEMAREETTDNVFSFSMPAKNITIHAEFAETDDSVAEDSDSADNAIYGNGNTGTVYERSELTDDEAASLQERIDSLPDVFDLYAEMASPDSDWDVDDIKNEAEELGNIYFNEITEDQREQINPALLFSTLMLTKTSYLVTDNSIVADDDEIVALQDRIDSLPLVPDIAGVTDVEEKHLVYRYGVEGGELYIDGNTQDELFLEVLNLAETVYNLDRDCAVKVGIDRLAKMDEFFTFGYTEAINGGATVTYADAESNMEIKEAGLMDGGLTMSEDGKIEVLEGSGEGVQELAESTQTDGIMAYAEEQDYGYIIPADGTTLPDGTPYHGVVFTFDAHTFEGRTLVIYEELQIKTADNEYMTVARHTDIADENQTVHIPKIKTNAVDSETLTHSSKMDGSMTIIDTVKYENLIPGFTYVLEGFLIDKPRQQFKNRDDVEKHINGECKNNCNTLVTPTEHE